MRSDTMHTLAITVRIHAAVQLRIRGSQNSREKIPVDTTKKRNMFRIPLHFTYL